MMSQRFITLEDIVRRVEPRLYVLVSNIAGFMEGVDTGASKTMRILAPGWADTSREEGMDQETRNALANRFEAMPEAMRNLGLPLTALSAQRLIERASSSGFSWHEFANLNRELSSRLQDELRSHSLFSIEPDKQVFLTDKPLFGELVFTAFPSAENDIQESGWCLAFERWTASVFHSMRVLEIGLNTLAKEFGVSFDHTNWGSIIDQIEKEIRSISKNNAGPDWKEQEQFYSEAALQFRYFKNAWRNHVMHARDPYDEQRATTVFEHVREFMRHLATRLHE